MGARLLYVALLRVSEARLGAIEPETHRRFRLYTNSVTCSHLLYGILPPEPQIQMHRYFGFSPKPDHNQDTQLKGYTPGSFG